MGEGQSRMREAIINGQKEEVEKCLASKKLGRKKLNICLHCATVAGQADLVGTSTNNSPPPPPTPLLLQSYTFSPRRLYQARC